MEIHRLQVGRLQANCYIVACTNTRKAIIIDPGGDPEMIIHNVAEKDYEIEYILNTHGHMDHVEANGEIHKALGGKLAIHSEDADMLLGATIFDRSRNNQEYKKPDLLLNDKDTIHFGDLTLEVIHTPGHTPGGVCFLVEDNLFSGDTLFSGSVGRWDFPGGSYSDLLRSLNEKLLVLEDAVVIYPGHGPSSTIGHERRHNPFLQ